MNNNGKILDCVRSGRPIAHIPVVDFHCHLGASSEWYHIPGKNAEDVVPYMDRFGVDHIVTFSINVTSDPTPGNNLQYRVARAFPKRISALTMLHAAFPQDWLPLLEVGYRMGSRGIKLISQYQGAAENSMDWSPVFEYARDKRWVALHHDWGGAERLRRWARTFPEIVFIIGHAATAYKDVVAECDNVYQCTCASFAFVSVEDMVNAMPAEKIVYGSDALDLDFGLGIGPIAFAGISEEKKEMILGRNALRIIAGMQWDIDIAQRYANP